MTKSYSNRYCTVAKKIYGLGGDDGDLAAALGATQSDIADWMHAHTEFAETCNSGKGIADDRVEESLRKLCTGYEAPAEKVRLYRGHVVRQGYKKKIPANSLAAQFYLTNVQRRSWKLPKDVRDQPPKDPVAEWFKSGAFQTLQLLEDSDESSE